MARGDCFTAWYIVLGGLSTVPQGDYLQSHGWTKYSAMDGPGDHL